MSFQIGDVVQVKSGGPLMTVSVVADDRVQTLWQSQDGEVFQGNFADPLLFKPFVEGFRAILPESLGGCPQKTRPS